MTTADADVSKNVSNQSRLETLIAAHLDMVYASALRQVRDLSAAEDITQTVFLIAAKKYASIPHERQGAWLFKVTRYVVLNVQRAEYRRRHHERRAAIFDESRAADVNVEEIRILAQLDAALHKLSAADRELIVRRFFQDQSVARIAEALHATENTASKRLGRALDRLRKRLISQGVSVSAALLPGILPSTAIRPAPSSLASKILHASTAPVAKTLTVSLGILLMNTATKWAIAMTLVLLLLMASAFLFSRSNVAPTKTPITSETAVVAAADDVTTTLTGTIKDTAGKPIVNAFIAQGFSPFAGSIYHYAYTNVDGQFEIPNVHIGDNLYLTAMAHGYSPAMLQYGTVTVNTPETPFVLSPGHIIRILFLDQRNQPLPSVRVDPIAWRAGGDNLRTHEFMRGANGRPPYDGMISDADGRFVWNSAPPEPVRFIFSKDEDHRSVQKELAPSDDENVIILQDALKMTVTLVDDQTNVPIPEFNCYIGQGQDMTYPTFWDQTLHPGVDGSSTFDLTDIREFNFLSVEAPGYAPLIHFFSDDPKSLTVSFRISKNSGLPLTVLQPNGQPDASAQVYSITAPLHQNASFQFPIGDPMEDVSNPTNPEFVKTDDLGQCRVIDPGPTPMRILIFADSGFAEFPVSQLKTTSRITLEPWASIKGQIKVGPNPVPSAIIMVNMWLKETPDAPGVFLQFRSRSDSDGNFSYPHILARPLTVARVLRPNSESRFSEFGSDWPTTDLTPSPGQSLFVPLGGSGQHVIGRIVASGTHASDPTWMLSLGSIGVAYPSAFTPQEKAELATLTPEQKQRRIKELNTPAREEAFEKALKASILAHPSGAAYFSVAPDGTFYAEGATPGPSTLSVHAMDPNTGKTLATAKRNFTVPPTPTTQPIDLGEIPMEKSP